MTQIGENKRILLLINPASSSYRRQVVDALMAELEQRAIPFVRLETHELLQKTVVAVEDQLRAHTITDVIVVGGDGTLHQAVNALAGYRLPMGYIPCGTGNDFARGYFGKTYKQQSLSEWIQQAIHGDVHAIDLGQVNQRYFINVAGVGFDAHVAKRLQGRKGRFPSLSYLFTALRILFTVNAQPIELSGSSQKLLALSSRPFFMLNFANGPYFGNGMKIAPHAHVDDGVLAYCFVETAGILRKLRALRRIYRGTHIQFKEVHCGQFHALQVQTVGLPIEVDGEYLGETPAFIRTIPAACLLRGRPLDNHADAFYS
ncbi:diacylglycerol kinase family lipid kinase [Aliidiomarina halalkaliphila]|uniref:Diacylglycerol kinase family lipid kinase n=1 Tax=Aliidiomarina halalkaliphila TaxID=2593535 RepID=A0A552X4B2_9GAMM|nr:diacylglycerol kinase family protein [Aliidiomarina halalkaliphila]TRW49867.1 diacylglycerol kinase family lipid kinase [Aliidiomarina halalkaliphila]